MTEFIPMQVSKTSFKTVQKSIHIKVFATEALHVLTASSK